MKAPKIKQIPDKIYVLGYEWQVIYDIDMPVGDGEGDVNNHIIKIGIDGYTGKEQDFLLYSIYVHELIEDGRVSIRNVRRDAIHQIKQFGEDQKTSEDLIHDAEAEIQTLTDDHIEILNKHQEDKEKELQEV